jgi:glycosyltransferase involved in cell wall biosynthesis
MDGRSGKLKIVVIIPCWNEAKTIGPVVEEYEAALPGAEIYIIDNNSDDGTADVAKEKGAKVIWELHQGKGNAVRTAFDLIDADVYLFTDGDGSLPAKHAPDLVIPILEGKFDMVSGRRIEPEGVKAYRTMHKFGNRLICFLINTFFNANYRDPLCGYRAVSKRFAQLVPLTSYGFEIETEICIKAKTLGLVVKEIDIDFLERRAGTKSKLKTFSDGFRILNTIITLFRYNRPLLLFGTIGITSFILGLITGGLVVAEYIEARYITHVPLAVLTAVLIMFGAINLVTAVILDNIKSTLIELHYYINRRILRR